MDYAVNIQNITRQYITKKGLASKNPEIVTAVNDVSLQIKKGEAIGLLGPNGAGKTTLIKMLTTVLIPTSGNINILGNDIIKDVNEIRQRVNVVYGGDKGLYTRLTARDNLKYFCNLYHIPINEQKEKIEKLLARVGLSEVADRRVENFSRGMKQKLHIARGLINDPEILFLDEPTIGLDPVSSLSIRSLVKELNQSGMTILLTTHYMQEAEEICDRVAIINKGKIVLLDYTENIKGRFRKSYTIEMKIDKKYSAGHKSINELQSKYQNFEFTDRNAEYLFLSFNAENINGVFRDISGMFEDSDITDLNIRTSSLEDAYIEIINSAK